MPTDADPTCCTTKPGGDLPPDSPPFCAVGSGGLFSDPCLEALGITQAMALARPLDRLQKTEIATEANWADVASFSLGRGELALVTAWGVEVVGGLSYSAWTFRVVAEGLDARLANADWAGGVGISGIQPGGLTPDLWVDLRHSPLILRSGTIRVQAKQTTGAAVHCWARLFGRIYPNACG